MDKNLNHNCFTDSNYFNRRILEVTEKGEPLTLLFFIHLWSLSYSTVALIITF